MIWVNSILGVLLVVGAIFGLIFLYRKVNDVDTPLFGAVTRKRDREGDNEIEAFIAAYRSGQADPRDLISGQFANGQALPESIPSAANAAPAASAAPASPVATAPARPAAFLRPEVKLAYLTFRSGLRDHHVFANVVLSDLGHGTAVGKVDLLICDRSFKYVALVDIYTGEQVEDIAKTLFLRRIGVKHLSLSSSEMPKPAQLWELIYGDQAG